MLSVLFLKDAAYAGTSGSEHINIPKKNSENQIFQKNLETLGRAKIQKSKNHKNEKKK